MSKPDFPTIDPSFTRENVINQILSSIAMEELGLSHIINAEGEKLQYALGTITGAPSLEQPATIEDLLSLNKSVREMLDGTMQNQLLLKAKLQASLDASVMQGPTGPTGATGPTGPASGPTGPSGPTGSPGIAATITVKSATAVPFDDGADVENAGTQYAAEFDFKIPYGPTGPTGSVEAFGVQASLPSAGSEREILAGKNIIFNLPLGIPPDISYDSATGIFTIHQTDRKSFYLINWWAMASGTSDLPVVLSVMVGGTAISSTSCLWGDIQIFGSALVATDVADVKVSLTNTGASSVYLSNAAVQAQITIVGFHTT